MTVGYPTAYGTGSHHCPFEEEDVELGEVWDVPKV